MSDINKLQLYVGNLSYEMKQEEIEDLFRDYDVETVKLIFDRESGRSRGFSFVTFKNEASAAEALKDLADQEIGGRKLTVKYSEDRKPGDKPRFGGGDRPKKSWDNNGGGNGGGYGGGRDRNR